MQPPLGDVTRSVLPALARIEKALPQRRERYEHFIWRVGCVSAIGAVVNEPKSNETAERDSEAVVHVGPVRRSGDPTPPARTQIIAAVGAVSTLALALGLFHHVTSGVKMTVGGCGANARRGGRRVRLTTLNGRD